MLLALLLAFCIALAVIAVFVGMLNLAGDEELGTRLAAYVGRPVVAAGQGKVKKVSSLAERLNRLISRQAFADRIATSMARANLPLTVPEFVLLTVGCVAVGGILGLFISGQLISGIILGSAGFFVPRLYVQHRQHRRQRSFEDQLSDVLTMLVGALRAGYGFVQSLDIVAQEMPPPACEEFRRAVQEVGLGLSQDRALQNLVRRMESDDLDMIITAINVQYEVGGNLAMLLETMSGAIRERMRIHREIRVITAQQRLTGYVLALVPFGLAAILLMLNPGYMMRLFQPGGMLCIPIGAIILIVLGFLTIQKIVAIDV